MGKKKVCRLRVGSFKEEKGVFMVSVPPQSLAVSRLVVDTSILFCLLIAQKIGSEEHARWESEMQKTERAARYNLVQALYRSQ